MTPSVVLSRPSPATYRKGTLQSPSSLRPSWDVILSILREPELNDAQRLFAWALESELDDARVIQLPHGPPIHIIGKAPTSEQ